jgi:DNA (cytosine-5)-methyltransferase 1
MLLRRDFFVDFLYPIQDRTRFLLTQDIPILSFFTGAGFLDIGFKRAGFKIIWRNELDSNFAFNFEYGMTALTGSNEEAKINAPLSIENLTHRQILNQAFQGTPRPNMFGIIGGPPCPDFSVGGKNRGGQGDHGKLLRVFLERIAKIQPTFFIVENVLGLVRTEKHRRFLQEVLQPLSKKYAVSIRMLNSLEFGVAQDRYRIFIIGMLRNWLRDNSDCTAINNGQSWKYTIEQIHRKVASDRKKNEQPDLFQTSSYTPKHWFPWPEDKRYINSKTRFAWPSSTPFGTIPEVVDGIPMELMVGPIICDQEEMASLPNGTEAFLPHCDRFYTIAEGDVTRKSFKRLHRWRYSPTAAYGNNEVHLHPSLARRLSVREACRIQSVPDEYMFPIESTLSSKFKMIGNGVPVRLAEAVGLSVAYAINGNFDQQLILNNGNDEEYSEPRED